MHKFVCNLWTRQNTNVLKIPLATIKRSQWMNGKEWQALGTFGSKNIHIRKPWHKQNAQNVYKYCIIRRPDRWVSSSSKLVQMGLYYFLNFPGSTTSRDFIWLLPHTYWLIALVYYLSIRTWLCPLLLPYTVATTVIATIILYFWLCFLLMMIDNGRQVDARQKPAALSSERVR